jgi:hypothetical protein
MIKRRTQMVELISRAPIKTDSDYLLGSAVGGLKSTHPQANQEGSRL